MQGGTDGNDSPMPNETGPTPASPLEYASDGTTLVEVMAAFEQQGFGGQMIARPNGMIRCVACDMEHRADEMVLHALRRTEGASDPADMAAVVAIECPHCHAKGTIALKFGPQATPEEDSVLALLDDQRTVESGGTRAGADL